MWWQAFRQPRLKKTGCGFIHTLPAVCENYTRSFVPTGSDSLTIDSQTPLFLLNTLSDPPCSKLSISFLSTTRTRDQLPLFHHYTEPFIRLLMASPPPSIWLCYKPRRFILVHVHKSVLQCRDYGKVQLKKKKKHQP